MTEIALDRPSPQIALIRLDRPEQRNAMNSAMLAEIERALTELESDADLRVLIF